MNIKRMAEMADDEADRLINMPGEYHPDWHDVRDSIFAALVLEEAAKVCDELAELSRTSPTDSMWQHGECAAAIRALKGAKE